MKSLDFMRGNLNFEALFAILRLVAASLQRTEKKAEECYWQP